MSKGNKGGNGSKSNNGGNYPSTTGNKSGKGRGNDPKSK